MLAPRRTYARLAPISPSYILYYVLFVAVLIASAASVSATGRVTFSLLVSLSVSWMFVPVLHVLIAAALVASANGSRVGRARAVALLLMGHAPWSLWLLLAGAMTGTRGYGLYQPSLLLAIVPLALTFRLVHAFCLEVLRTSPRGAVVRTLAHQGMTWLVAAIYLDRAVGLWPRIQGWLQ
jgi:hypothetical protein